jgi:nucleotide-binding universal stress UspA family protein
MAKIDIRRILYPTDFSDPSRRAFEYALAVAAWYEAALTALHVIPETMAPGSEMAHLGNPMLLVPTAQEAARYDLAAVAATARKLGLHAETDLREGKPATEIVALADALPADLVVMSTHGRAGVPRWVLGSVAETVLRRVQCPVLTVPAHAPEHPGPLFFKTILCATDFSPASSAALRYAVSLAVEAEARLTLAHVLDLEKLRGLEHHRDRDGRQLDFERAAGSMLRSQLQKHPPDGFSSDTAVAWGAPASQILRLARAPNAGLIVMGVHGRSLLDLMAFGSVTHDVVRAAACPVLTVRPPSGRNGSGAA